MNDHDILEAMREKELNKYLDECDQSIDRYDKCLEEVTKICKPMKETLVKCLDLESNYNVDKYVIYKEMVEMELFNYFCELMESTK